MWTKEKAKEYNKQYREKNGEILRQKDRKRYDPVKRRARRIADLERIRERDRNYWRSHKELYAQRPKSIAFKLRKHIRSRIFKVLRGNKKQESSIKALGCTVAYLKSFIEKQFTSEMTWDNWGSYWHLDHVVPLALFDLTNYEQFMQACHYSNLQPLTVEENMRKGSKLHLA